MIEKFNTLLKVAIQLIQIRADWFGWLDRRRGMNIEKSSDFFNFSSH